MKLRRAMAVSAATTLVAGVALAAAPAALAAPAVSAVAAVPAAPKLGGTVSLNDFPATVAAGGTQVTFSETVTNTGDDAVALPVVFLTSVGDLSTDQVKAQFQNPYTHKWVDAQMQSDGPDGPGVALILGSLGNDAEPDENAVVFVPAGKSVTVQVRLTVAADAVAGAATAKPYAVLFPASESEEEPEGDDLLEGAKKAFTITAPGGASASASASAKPSASASASAAPSASAKPSASASASASAKPSASVKPSASASSSAVPTAAPSGLPTKKPSTTTVDEAKKQAQSSLASTGGGSDSTAIAATGAAALVLGAGTLVLVRRRRTNTHRAQ